MIRTLLLMKLQIVNNHFSYYYHKLKISLVQEKNTSLRLKIGYEFFLIKKSAKLDFSTFPYKKIFFYKLKARDRVKLELLVSNKATSVSPTEYNGLFVVLCAWS